MKVMESYIWKETIENKEHGSKRCEANSRCCKEIRNLTEKL